MALSLELGKSVCLYMAAPGIGRQTLLALGARARLSSTASVARGFGVVCRKRALKAGIIINIERSIRERGRIAWQVVLFARLRMEASEQRARRSLLPTLSPLKSRRDLTVSGRRPA